MTIEDVKKFKEYFYKKIADFDESSMITPNINGEKESGKPKKATLEIKKEEFWKKEKQRKMQNIGHTEIKNRYKGVC